jgi:hypothetical protein
VKSNCVNISVTQVPNPNVGVHLQFVLPCFKKKVPSGTYGSICTGVGKGKNKKKKQKKKRKRNM